MSGQWEKYVPAAMRAGHDAFFATERYGDDGELLPVKREDVWRATAEAMLAVVGPLIAEDTRDRLVAAAGRAVERETYCTTPRGNRGDGRGCEDDHCPRHGGNEEAAS